MKETKPEWYSIAKGDLGESLFTEEMKREVGRRVVGQPGSEKKRGRRIAGAVAIALGIAAILLIYPTVRPDSPAPSPAVTDAPSPTPPPESADPEPSEPRSPLAGWEIPLVYESPENRSGDYPVEVIRVAASKVRLDSLYPQRTIDLDDLGRFVVYVKKQGDAELYVGMEIPNASRGQADATEVYEIGRIGEIAYLSEVSVSKSFAFGRFGLLIHGVCGANCVTNYWIRFEEGIPVSDFRLNAHAQEIDLDEDGIPEVVATETSTIGKVQIYKKFEDDVLFVDVNAALDAEHPDSIVYDSSRRTFTAIFADRRLDYQYQKGADVLMLTEDSSMELDNDRLIRGGRFDGSESIRFEAGDSAYDATWFQDPLQLFGLYLPSSVKAVKFEDGYEYEALEGKARIQLRIADPQSLPYLRKEADLSDYSDYLGTEYWGDRQNIRYDYFEYSYDEGNTIYIAIRYPTESTDEIRPLLLAVAYHIRYNP